MSLSGGEVRVCLHWLPCWSFGARCFVSVTTVTIAAMDSAGWKDIHHPIDIEGHDDDGLIGPTFLTGDSHLVLWVGKSMLDFLSINLPPSDTWGCNFDNTIPCANVLVSARRNPTLIKQKKITNNIDWYGGACGRHRSWLSRAVLNLTELYSSLNGGALCVVVGTMLAAATYIRFFLVQTSALNQPIVKVDSVQFNGIVGLQVVCCFCLLLWECILSAG